MADGSGRFIRVAYTIFSIALILAKPIVNLPSSSGPFFTNDAEWPNELCKIRLQSYGHGVQNLTAKDHPRSPREDHSPLRPTIRDSQESEGWPKVENPTMVIVDGLDDDKAEQLNATSITESDPNSPIHRLQRESNASALQSEKNEVTMIPSKVRADSPNRSRADVPHHRTRGLALQPKGTENRRGKQRKDATTSTSTLIRTTQTESGTIGTNVSSHRMTPQVSYEASVTPAEPEYRGLMNSPPNNQTSFSLASETTAENQSLVTSKSEAEATVTSKLQTQPAMTAGTESQTTVTSESVTSGSPNGIETGSVDHTPTSDGITSRPISPISSETLTTILTTFWDFRPVHTFRPLPTDDGVPLCPCPSTTESPTSSETDEEEEYESNGATTLEHGRQPVTSLALVVLLALRNVS